jgi:hypothetical protein
VHYYPALDTCPSVAVGCVVKAVNRLSSLVVLMRVASIAVWTETECAISEHERISELVCRESLRYLTGQLPYPGYAIQIASYGMRYVGIFAERICVKHP